MKNINKITKIKETYLMVDNVNNPAHYTIGKGVETIESIEHQLSTDQFRGYLKGNICKYLFRYEKKNYLEDLLKAQWYMNYLIEFERRIQGE